eukprot:5567563-Amphidinium_carterae.1
MAGLRPAAAVLLDLGAKPIVAGLQRWVKENAWTPHMWIRSEARGSKAPPEKNPMAYPFRTQQKFSNKRENHW